MGNSDAQKNLPETQEDQKFLLEMPDDLDAACLQIEDRVGARIISGELIGVEMVAAVKEALRLPHPYDRGSTIVICNALRETMELCGFASPEVILQKLAERRRKLQETLKTK